MTITTKAAVLREIGSPLSIEDGIRIPDLRRGQVLVELAFSGVCHSQIMEINGHRGEDRYIPHMLGHEAVGIVRSVGPAVSKVRSDDWVIAGWIKGHGLEGGPVVYDSKDGEINAGSVATFSEFAVISENRLTLLPPNIPPEAASSFGCAIPTGAGMVLNTARPSSNDSVAIFGLGGVGLAALLACQHLSPRLIVAIDPNEKKLEIAKNLGATKCINPTNSDVQSALLDLTENKGIDFAFEATGLPHVIEQAFQCVKKFGGQCVFAGHPPHGSTISLDPFDLISGKKITGTWGGSSNPDHDVPIMAKLYNKDTFPFSGRSTKVYQLDDINEAIYDLMNGKSVRPLIRLSNNL